MYEYIKGILTKITAKYIVVETAGIGYLLHVANPYAYSGKMNQEVHVYLHQVVREDAHLLYGFATEEEKQLFLNLISSSLVGLWDLSQLWLLSLQMTMQALSKPSKARILPT